MTGPVHTPRALTSAATLSLLENDLNVTVQDVAQQFGAPVSHPGEINGYRLYPGGATYYAQAIGTNLSDTTLEPDPQSNPLGIFKYPTQLRLYDNVKIRGTILTYDLGVRGDLEFYGTNVQVLPLDLPALHGDNQTYQLPSAIVADDLSIHGNSSGSLNGLALTWDDFEMVTGSANTSFEVQGKLIVAELELHSRSEWDYLFDWWKAKLSDFYRDVFAMAPSQHFPEWLESVEALDPSPCITIRPDAANISYHWPDWSQPLFVAHPDDGGLRWDLVDWRDNP